MGCRVSLAERAAGGILAQVDLRGADDRYRNVSGRFYSRLEASVTSGNLSVPVATSTSSNVVLRANPTYFEWLSPRPTATLPEPPTRDRSTLPPVTRTQPMADGVQFAFVNRFDEVITSEAQQRAVEQQVAVYLARFSAQVDPKDVRYGGGWGCRARVRGRVVCWETRCCPRASLPSFSRPVGTGARARVPGPVWHGASMCVGGRGVCVRDGAVVGFWAGVQCQHVLSYTLTARLRAAVGFWRAGLL